MGSDAGIGIVVPNRRNASRRDRYQRSQWAIRRNSNKSRACEPQARLNFVIGLVGEATTYGMGGGMITVEPS